MKYTEPEKWEELKALFREVKWEKDAQANGIAKGSEHKVPYTSAANSVFYNYKNGMLESRRYYGQNGKPRLDIDMTDHGNSKEHPNAPHRHNWENKGNDTMKRQKDQPPSTADRIANADIWKKGNGNGLRKTGES